jgi:hypothetical protein
MTLRVIHITLLGEVTAGQRKQLLLEKKSAEGLNCTLTQLIYTCRHSSCNTDILRVPFLVRGHALRGLFLWYLILRSYFKFDVIMVRYLPFNPFMPLILWMFRSKICLVYHGRMVDRLKLIKGARGIFASYVEAMLQSIYPNEIAGAIGVTKELIETECSIFQGKTKKFIYPNGILNLNDGKINDSSKGVLEIVFMCGIFSRWQGLDRLLHEITTYNGKARLVIHIVGQLSNDQQAEFLENTNELIDVLIHGYLEPDAYQSIISRCKYGIAPLAIDRMGVSESSSLKVREYLANGLMVITNHFDIALDNQAYAFDLRMQRFSDLALHYERSKLSRKQVMELSYPLINKSRILERLFEQFNREFS